MSLIRLKNLSKYYYNKGIIASGISKINLNLDMGEFVAITGESGSGKSTLLNVISGIDTYEDGEMFINDKETSHYTEKDFENYRRQYIGNIFQNFNLVNSYTVYQNIELVLLLNGSNKKDIKKKVLDLINKVGLKKFKNTKISKLSGGQKQRVAIARALAKDTPIIIADEPTGNLDANSAKSVIKLLSEVAKDKLVIIVTHNYEQVSDYVTRKINMHDGKILEDKIIKSHDEVEDIILSKYKNMTIFSKLRIAFRNTFNIIPKFLLVLAVYLFITVALISEYAFFREQQFETENSGYNYVFNNTDDKRIILKKHDKTSFTEDEYKKIESLENIDYVIKTDILSDSLVNLTNNNELWLDGYARDLSTLKGGVDVGRKPENDNEIVIEGPKDHYYIAYAKEDILNKEFYFQNYYTGDVNLNEKVKVVGIKYLDNDNYNLNLYLSGDVLNNFLFEVNQRYSKTTITFDDKIYDENSNTRFNVSYSDLVQPGNIYIPDTYKYLCLYENCINKNFNISINNLYYNDGIDLKVSKVFNKWNINSLLSTKDYENNTNTVYINTSDYNNLYNKADYQSSVFVKDSHDIDEVKTKLNDLGYDVLVMKDVLAKEPFTKVMNIIRTVVTIILVIVLFFISYFVITIILKSRNVYFSTLRMLGANRKISKELLVMELIIDSNIAFFTFMVMLYLNTKNVINLGFLSIITTYLTFGNYLLLYTILILMSYLISQKFAKKLFKKSVITTLGEEI